ncbi:MAG: hypothetical protein SFZ03_06665 [Candidatus Melainabacteria bacterium]|nr:hypothetical protein [Candidatus Melainabacteria bacterium]
MSSSSSARHSASPNTPRAEAVRQAIAQHLLQQAQTTSLEDFSHRLADFLMRQANGDYTFGSIVKQEFGISPNLLDHPDPA